MKIRKKTYSLETDGYRLSFFKEDKLFIEIPLSVSVNGTSSELEKSNITDDKIVLKGKDEELVVNFYEDCVTVSYQKDFREFTPIYEVSAFSEGIQFPHFDRAFCPQGHPYKS